MRSLRFNQPNRQQISVCALSLVAVLGDDEVTSGDLHTRLHLRCSHVMHNSDGTQQPWSRWRKRYGILVVRSLVCRPQRTTIRSCLKPTCFLHGSKSPRCASVSSNAGVGSRLETSAAMQLIWPYRRRCPPIGGTETRPRRPRCSMNTRGGTPWTLSTKSWRITMSPDHIREFPS